MAKNRRLVIIIVILLLATVCRFAFVSVPTIPGKYFDRPLPDQLEHWSAQEFYTCPKCREIIEKEVKEKKLEHDPNARLFFFVQELKVQDGKCPFHNIDISGSKTVDLPTSPVVIRALPEDTEFVNRIYLNGKFLVNKEQGYIDLAPGSQLLNVSIVTSGKDKRSIHRAERCLQSQGNQMISHKRIWLDIPKSKRKKLDVTAIRLQRTMENGNIDRSMAMYFYAGNTRVTADNFKRIAYMAWDRMIVGMNYRWSYILMTARVYPGRTYKDTEKAMLQFVTELFPLVEK